MRINLAELRQGPGYRGLGFTGFPTLCDGSGKVSFGLVSRSQIHASNPVVRVHLEGLTELLNCLIILTSIVKILTCGFIHLDGKWIEFHGSFTLRDPFFKSPDQS